MTTPDERVGKLDPTVESASPEGWRRWAYELGQYDRERVAEFGGVVLGGALIGIVVLYLFILIADQMPGNGTAALDTAAFRYIHQFSSEPMDALARAISFMGSEAVIICSLILLGLFLGQRRWGAASMVVLVWGGVQVLNSLLKMMFHRTRPVPVLGVIDAQQYSFPSGHAMVSAAFYTYLIYLCLRLVHGTWRVVLMVGLVGLVGLIGLSRIYLQAHYFSDVIAGWLAGFLWADAVIIGSQLLVTRGMPR